MNGIFKSTIILISYFLFMTTSLAGTVYWHVDDEGVTHFGPMPTADSSSSSGQYDYEDVVESPNIIVNDDFQVKNNDTEESLVDQNLEQGDTVYFNNDSLKQMQSSEESEVTHSSLNTSQGFQSHEYQDQQEQQYKKKRHIINLSNSPYHEEDFE